MTVLFDLTVRLDINVARRYQDTELSALDRAIRAVRDLRGDATE